MDAKTLKKFKDELEKTREELTSSSIMSEEFHINKDEQMDDVDSASADTDQSLQLRLKSRETLYLRKVNEALQKIAEGTFGDCDECGGDIEVKRLKARPTANLCIDCKEEQEKMENSTAGGRRSKSLGVTWRPKD